MESAHMIPLFAELSQAPNDSSESRNLSGPPGTNKSPSPFPTSTNVVPVTPEVMGAEEMVPPTVDSSVLVSSYGNTDFPSLFFRLPTLQIVDDVAPPFVSIPLSFILQSMDNPEELELRDDWMQQALARTIMATLRQTSVIKSYHLVYAISQHVMTITSDEIQEDLTLYRSAPDHVFSPNRGSFQLLNGTRLCLSIKSYLQSSATTPAVYVDLALESSLLNQLTRVFGNLQKDALELIDTSTAQISRASRSDTSIPRTLDSVEEVLVEDVTIDGSVVPLTVLEDPKPAPPVVPQDPPVPNGLVPEGPIPGEDLSHSTAAELAELAPAPPSTIRPVSRTQDRHLTNPSPPVRFAAAAASLQASTSRPASRLSYHSRPTPRNNPSIGGVLYRRNGEPHLGTPHAVKQGGNLPHPDEVYARYDTRGQLPMRDTFDRMHGFEAPAGSTRPPSHHHNGHVGHSSPHDDTSPSSRSMLQSWHQYCANVDELTVLDRSHLIPPWSAYHPDSPHAPIRCFAVAIVSQTYHKERYLHSFDGFVYQRGDYKREYAFKKCFPSVPKLSSKTADLYGWYNEFVECAAVHGVYAPPLISLSPGNLLGDWVAELPSEIRDHLDVHANLMLQCLKTSPHGLEKLDEGLSALLKSSTTGWDAYGIIAYAMRHPRFDTSRDQMVVPVQSGSVSLQSFVHQFTCFVQRQVLDGRVYSIRYFLSQLTKRMHPLLKEVQAHIHANAIPATNLSYEVPERFNCRRLPQTLQQFCALTLQDPDIFLVAPDQWRRRLSTTNTGGTGPLDNTRLPRIQQVSDDTNFAALWEQVNAIKYPSAAGAERLCLFCDSKNHLVNNCSELVTWTAKNSSAARALRAALSKQLSTSSSFPRGAAKRIASLELGTTLETLLPTDDLVEDLDTTGSDPDIDPTSDFRSAGKME